MSSYARPMPYLGLDPAPGDVALARQLASRYFQVGQELEQILGLIGHLDLDPWQGKAGDAMRAAAGTFPPALRAAADTARQLQAATRSWAGQLSEFQAEADVLERKAAAASAQHQALQARQLAGSRSAALNGDLEAASAALSAAQRQAQDLHQRYLAAAQKTAEQVEEQSGLWGKTEPVRTILEAVLAPLDIVAADHWVDALKEIAGVPAEWVNELGSEINVAESLMREGKLAEASEALIKAGNLAESTGTRLDAWAAFAPGWLRTSAQSLAEIKGFSYTLTGLGIVADMGTVISPQDAGAMGLADRGVALTNGLLLAANAADILPGYGEVMIAVTGIYLASDYLYHHWTPFRDVADDIGHAAVHGGKEAVHLAEDAGHGISSAWHSTIGSWF